MKKSISHNLYSFRKSYVSYTMFKHFSFSLIVFFLLTGCTKKKVGPNVPFELKINQSAVVSANGSSINVKFIQLVEESRCPPNEECIWAGRVAIKLKINNNEEFIIGLNHSNYPSTFNYMNREYALLDVNYTNEASFGIENKCVVKLEVK
jgi:hypothetical protein